MVHFCQVVEAHTLWKLITKFSCTIYCDSAFDRPHQTTSKLKSNFIISFSLFIHFKIHLMCVCMCDSSKPSNALCDTYINIYNQLLGIKPKEGRSMFRGLCHEALIRKENEIRFTHHVLCTSR